jgi:site-specific DNA-methyltransferase (cytosine-N4-specific)
VRHSQDEPTPDTPVDAPPASARPLPLVSHGDAFDMVARLPPRSVACVLTSPPYWGLRTYGHSHDEQVLDRWRLLLQAARPAASLTTDPERVNAPGYEWYRSNGGQLGREPYPEWYVAHLVEIFERMRPALRKDANLWVNLGDTYFARWSSIREGRQGLGAPTRTRRVTPTSGWLHDKQLLLIPSRFAIGMQEAGWILRNDVIWDKPDPVPRPETDRLRLSHEHLFHFVQRTRGGRPSYYYDLSGVESGKRDVVRVRSRPPRTDHPATFPAELIAPRIASSCPPGGLVLDPFCGSGSTLEVALELGRLAHGVELSERFAESARVRVRRARIAGQIMPSTPETSGRATPSRTPPPSARLLAPRPNSRRVPSSSARVAEVPRSQPQTDRASG